MIIYRYLSRQLLFTTLSVSSVLVMILVCGRFIKFLSEVVSGRFSAEAVFTIMLYRLPGFLELILPLGLFLGVLLAYGRMYLENEMTVLEACGFSQTKLLTYTLVPALSMSLVVGSFSLVIGPWGEDRSQLLIEEQKLRSGLEVLSPGRFHSAHNGQIVTYAEKTGQDKGTMLNLFIVSYHEREPSKVTLMLADSGSYRIDSATGVRYLVLKNGYRVEGAPGEPDYNRASFKQYDMRIEDPEPIGSQRTYEHLPTMSLLRDPAPAARAELLWRISVPILVPIVVFLAIPLSRVNPRQGRYLKLLPAIMIYLSYLALLLAAKSAIEKGRMPPVPSIVCVHALFFSLAFLIHNWNTLILWRRKRISERSEVPV